MYVYVGGSTTDSLGGRDTPEISVHANMNSDLGVDTSEADTRRGGRGDTRDGGRLQTTSSTDQQGETGMAGNQEAFLAQGNPIYRQSAEGERHLEEPQAV